MNKRYSRRRRGAFALEAALVLPLMMFMFLAMIVGGVGVLRYQQVACLAREATRFATVHGGNYKLFTGTTPPTQQAIYEQAVVPMAAGMPLDCLAIQVFWIDQSTGTAYAWDSASKDDLSITPFGEYITNTVRVTVTYQWTPGIFGMSPLVIQSTSEIPMMY